MACRAERAPDPGGGGEPSGVEVAVPGVAQTSQAGGQAGVGAAAAPPTDWSYGLRSSGIEPGSADGLAVADLRRMQAGAGNPESDAGQAVHR